MSYSSPTKDTADPNPPEMSGSTNSPSICLTRVRKGAGREVGEEQFGAAVVCDARRASELSGRQPGELRVSYRLIYTGDRT